MTRQRVPVGEMMLRAADQAQDKAVAAGVAVVVLSSGIMMRRLFLSNHR